MKHQNRRTVDDKDAGNNLQWSFKNILKDIEALGSSHMTWKEKKDYENRKIASLGGKPPKKQRLPLSVARVQMKKQKEREEKALQEQMILGRFGGGFGGRIAKRSTEKRKPEERVFKSSVGDFRHGVLNVKHLLNAAAASNEKDSGNDIGDKRRKGKGKKKSKGKKKGGHKKRR